MESRYSLLDESLFADLPLLHSEIESQCTSGENYNLLVNCLAGTNQPSPSLDYSSHDSVHEKERENDQIEKKNEGSTSQVTETNEGQRIRTGRWTQEEHESFLDGLKKFGEGNWREISMHCVKTRDRRQVASHAQKYFQRDPRSSRRSSINDIRTVESPHHLHSATP